MDTSDASDLHLVDSHCHLTFPPLCDDLGGVLARCAADGVEEVVVPAYDPASWAAAAALDDASGVRVRSAYGLHPWVADQPLDLDALAAYLADARAAAVGEIGLDGKIERPTLAEQVPVLERQLALARDLDRPVILHVRGAFSELLDLLGRFTPHLRGVVHAWSRPVDLARRFLDLGLMLGIGGAVTRPRASGVRGTVAAVPLECLVLETDAPSIGLDGVDPVACEPRHVRTVAATIAELRGDSVEHVASRTTAVAARLFGH
jgi:TatD DNase family protein